MKKLIYIFTATVLGASLCACNDDASGEKNDQSDFQIACEKSGGEFKGPGRCQCQSAVCNENVVCDKITKSCTTNDSPLSGLCINDTIICNNSQLYECQNNHWEKSDLANCENGCRTDHSGCAECVHDICKEGKVQKCEDGKLSNATSCEPLQCASDGISCAHECEDSTIICKDNKLYNCEDNHYTEKESCPAGCNPKTQNTCAKTCTEDNIICTDGILKTCKSGKYDEGTACENGNSCAGDSKCGVCKDNDIRCIDDEDTQNGRIELCRQGEYVLSENCPSSASCDGETTCGECHNGDVRCVDDENGLGHFETCVNGKYSAPEPCPSEASCASENKCGECRNDKTKCTNLPDGTGQAAKCIQGTFVEGRIFLFEDEFTPGASCGSVSCYGNRCGQCKNGVNPWCGADSSMLHSCSEGREITELCNTILPGSKCITPSNGVSKCN